MTCEDHDETKTADGEDKNLLRVGTEYCTGVKDEDTCTGEQYGWCCEWYEEFNESDAKPDWTDLRNAQCGPKAGNEDKCPVDISVSFLTASISDRN